MLTLLENFGNEIQNSVEMLNAVLENISTRRGHNIYNCPFCASGERNHGTPALHTHINYKNGKAYYKCFSCDARGDIFDLWANYYGKDIKTSIDEVFNFINANEPLRAKNELYKAYTNKGEIKDYTNFLLQASKRINVDFWKRRGISIDTVKHFYCGYEPKWVNFQTNEYSPRIIIPTSRHCFLARDSRLDEELTPEEREKTKVKRGHYDHVFNYMVLKELQDGDNLFIVEGEIDAMSLYDCGENKVIALCSASNIDIAVKELKTVDEYVNVIIALDNDKAGQDATVRLKDKLKSININASVINLYGEYKDANEILIKDREQLQSNIREVHDTLPF